MLYRSLYRDQHENHTAARRLNFVAKLLNAARILYLVFSAVMLGFALVKHQPRLQIAAGVFLASSFVLQLVRSRMLKRAIESVKPLSKVRF